MTGDEVPLSDVGKWAREISCNLIRFEILQSTTSEKTKALEGIAEHRLALSEIFDVVCPGWVNSGD